MFFTGIGTATPPRRYTKAECWSAFQESDWFARLDRRSHAIAEAVLLRDNGISTRRLALDSLAEVFAIDPDTLHRRFATHAPALATEAAVEAMRDAGIGARDIDAVVVSTCTGYLCPGLTSYLAERLGLRANVQASTWSARAASRRCPTCGLPMRSSPPALANMCFRCVSK